MLPTIILSLVALGIGYRYFNRRQYWRSTVVALTIQQTSIYLGATDLGREGVLTGLLRETFPEGPVLTIWKLAILVCIWVVPPLFLVYGAKRARQSSGWR